MGDKSTPAGEPNVYLGSPAAVKYSAALEAALRASEFQIRLPISVGTLFLLFFLVFYLL
uniref:hypothetical protein n=1 Tax=Pararhizobium sp. IMCC3301 TaxID=3067904 RepID=UPI0027403ECF|nr:hypothetical protein [Pararhizobium sp. IMCC3301]